MPTSSEEYEYKWNDFEELMCCDSCHAEAPLMEYERSNMNHKGEKKNICELCAKSFAGNAYEYPTQYPKTATIIAQVGNIMLDKLTDRRKDL